MTRLEDKPSEHTPLVATPAPELNPDHPHCKLLERLDSEYNRDDITDHPQCALRRAMKRNFQYATSPSGHCHPFQSAMELQSPAFLVRIQQAIEHGFRNVMQAMIALLRTARKSEHPTTRSIYPGVVTVFVIAVLTMLTMTSISPSLLLYMNHVGFTSSTNIAPYIIASAFSSAVPIVSNIVLGSIATAWGPGTALAIGSFAAAVGIIMFAVFRNSLLLFYIGYALYTSSNSLRVIRVSILSRVVPLKQRTTILATHTLMTPIGALIGPLLWILFSSYPEQTFWGPFRVDRFDMAYAAATISLIIISLVSISLLRTITSHDGEVTSGGERQSHLRVATIHLSNGNDQIVNLDRYRRNIFIYFCVIMLGVNMSAGVFMTAFQPVLVNTFKVTDAKLGWIFELIALLAIVPPLLVALLSRYLMDRQILVIGLMIKLIGMALFLPLFGHVREWQVVAGFMLIIKASIFFSTAGMSLFTKLLGSMNTSQLLGFLSSASSVGPAVAQIALSDHIVNLFGAFWFGLFAIPALVSLLLVLLPTYWKRLDSNNEFTQLVLQEAQSQHREAVEGRTV